MDCDPPSTQLLHLCNYESSQCLSTSIQNEDLHLGQKFQCTYLDMMTDRKET